MLDCDYLTEGAAVVRERPLLAGGRPATVLNQSLGGR